MSITPVRLDWTPCTYGGTRAWFICPAAGCGRRVAKLYLGGRIFACRHCYQLVYESQREDASKRALRKAQRIRVRLGRSTSLADFFPEKPKGMHWCTYERRRAEAMDAEACSWAALAVKLERWRGQLG